MLRSYLTTALRHLRKQPLYTFINVIGLAVGLAAFLLISLFVRYELTYDEFHEKADRIYRVVKEDPGNFYLGTNRFAVTPAPLETGLREDIAGVEATTQINDTQMLLAAAGEDAFYEWGMRATESFFDVFSYPLLRGDGATALSDPYSIVLTRSLALKLFGTENVVGRSVRDIDDDLDYAVTGLVGDAPKNAHFTFEFLVSMNSDEGWVRNADSWGNNNYYTYFVAAPGVDAIELETRIRAYGHERLAENEYYSDNPERISNYITQPLTDIHLRSHVNFEIGQNGDIKFVRLFSAIAVFILVIACINYMNLATARSAARAREIGIRKVSGAGRGQLVRQLLGESLLIAGAAIVVATGIVAAALPEFSELMERDVPYGLLFSGSSLSIFLLCGLGAGLVAGSYPALVMSRLKPSVILSGGSKGSPATGHTSMLRNVLVVTQFTIGIVLIVGTVVVHDQLRFMNTAETGMDRDHVMAVLYREGGLGERWDAISNALTAIPGVSSVSSSSHLPTRISSQSTTSDWEGNEEGLEVPIYNTSVNHGFTELLGLEFVEGRGFSPEYESDAGEALVINETAMRALGWSTAVGKDLDFGGRGNRVVGVVKDFNYQSFRQPIEPLALHLTPDWHSNILVRISAGDVAATVDRIEELMKGFSPDYPFEYQFLDDAYDSMYRADRRFGEIFGWFAGIALAIACLGLFALAAYMTERRTKEIGVRKALGATAANIAVLMSRDIGRLVLVAIVLAAPISWFAMNRWLEDFAFRVPFGWQTIVISGLAALLLAWATVAWQSVKAARTNPVDALRCE